MVLLPPAPKPMDPDDDTSPSNYTSASDLGSEPIEGPHGWSGRSRFNSNQIDADNDGDAS